jgi:DNA-binding transcriptional regulator YiaG
MSVNGSAESRRIREMRRTAGLSQQRIAELADCSVSMVRLLESGWRPESHSAVLDRIYSILHEEGRPAMNETPLQTSARTGRHGSG